MCIAYTAMTQAQTEVVKGQKYGKDYGVVYSLPKTKIEVDLTIEKTVFKPGELAEYANKYLRINNAGNEEKTTYRITSTKIRTVGVANKEATYFIKMKDRTTAPLVEMTKEGVIKSINVEYIPEKKEIKEVVRQDEKSKSIDGRKFLNEEMLMAGSRSKMAELIAKEIYSIRESKNDLLKGQAENTPQDGEQLKLMLDNLSIQEQALTEMFTGTTYKETSVETVSIIPEGEMKDEVLFRFSKKMGLVDKDNLVGEPYYISIKRTSNLQQIEPEDVKSKKKELEGIAYNTPETVIFTIRKDNEKIREERLPIAQMGVVEYLAPILFNKNTVTKVYFDTSTGGLIKVERAGDR